MGLTLPGGLAPVVPSEDKDKDNLEKAGDLAQESLFSRIASIPEAIGDSVTGANDQLEFPEVPEMSEMIDQAPGFIEALIPNLKVFLD